MPRPDQIQDAEAIRAQLNLVAPIVPDREASQATILFEPMKYNGALIPAGTRINWDDPQKGRIVKRAALDLWDREEYNPDNYPDGWDDIEYHDGVKVIPDAYKPGQMFDQGEAGWWHGSAEAEQGVYISQIPANVTQPGDERWWKRKADGEPEQPEDGGTDEPAVLAPAWDSLEANHPFAVGDRFSDGGVNYLVKRAFARQDHMRPPALLGDYYVVDEG